MTYYASNALSKNSFMSRIDTLGEVYIAINISLRSGLFRIWHFTAHRSPIYDELEIIISPSR